MTSEPFDAQIEDFRKKILERFPKGEPSGSEQEEWLDTAHAALEELQIASEELRQQNDELYQAQVLLQRESHRYQSLFDAAPDAYLVTDRLGIIRQANQAAIELLNIPPHRIVGRPLATFLRGAELQEMLTNLRAITVFKERMEWQTHLHPRARGKVSAQISVVFQEVEAGQEPQMLWLIRDVTGYGRMQQQVYEAQERFRIIFEAARVGILFLDLRGRVLQSNQAFRDILGLSAADLYEYHYPALLNLDNPAEEYEKFDALTGGSLDRYEAERLARRKDGRKVWVRMILSLLLDGQGQPQYALGICEDITLQHEREREQIEVERSLEEAIDRERTSLARELHDGPLQYQINLIFIIQQIMADIKDPELLAHLENLRDEARRIVNMLRMTTGFLRFTILNTFGLDRAIQSYVDQIQASTDITLLTDLKLPTQVLTLRLQQGVYRIFQSTLINALRHARAHLVTVRIYDDDQGYLIFEVEDDGQGFKVPDRWLELSQNGHYGLIGCAERAAGMGGILMIHSGPDEGTVIRAKIPLSEEEQKKKRLTDLDLEIPRF